MRLVKYSDPWSLMKRFYTNPNHDDFGLSNTWYPAVDIIDEEDCVVVAMDLPGIKKEEIQINVEDKILTISGERTLENQEKTENYYRRERKYGDFKRVFTLSDEILSDEINAQFKEGVLKIFLKKNKSKPLVKQITIH